MLIVRRKCLRSPSPGEEDTPEPIALEATRAFSAYALLGDPGSGKSKAFELEAAACGGVRIPAGDFLGLDHPDLQNADCPIFIDGLDETRAGAADGRSSIDGIRRKLQQLGCKRFRVSCRAADWLGQPDVHRLQSLLAEGESVQVFKLEPLTLADVATILQANYSIADPQAFIATAERHRLTDLLFNPQTLDMLARAVGVSNTWPESRLATYELACARLAEEHNDEHAAATRRTAPNHHALRKAAGYLCTIQLIADLSGYFRGANCPERALALNLLPNPEGLPLDDAIASRLFKEVGGGVFAPVHRTVAEFLAAGYLAGRLQDKLSLRRLLALICGADGGVVSGMRGLSAWLASVSTAARLKCSQLDPLGVLVYGDAHNFSIPEKETLLDALDRLAEFSPSFRWRDWDEGKAFAALVTPEMNKVIESRLSTTDRSDAGQATVVMLIQGLGHVSPAPWLAPALLAVARNSSWKGNLRVHALDAYLRVAGEADSALRQLMDDIYSDVVSDTNDELLGTLLGALYPRYVLPSEVTRYLRSARNSHHIGRYTMFWRYELNRATTNDLLPALLDAIALRADLRRSDVPREYAKPAASLLARALLQFGDEMTNHRLLDWLDACCDKHGNSLLEKKQGDEVRQWLEQRPERYLSLLDLALIRYWTDNARAWPAGRRLHGAKAPEDICLWWLSKADSEPDRGRAEEYFIQAVGTLPDEAPRLDAFLSDCERVAQRQGWEQRLTEMLTCDLAHWDWKLEEATRKKERQQRAIATRDFYRERLAEFSGPMVPMGTLDLVANAYQERFHDIAGDTPTERLDDLFGGDKELVEAALGALRNAILRDDLPTMEDTLDAAVNNQVMTWNAPALISLELRHRADPAFLSTLAPERLKAAVVAHLVHVYEDHDSWVIAVVLSHPAVVAEALSAYVLAMLHGSKSHAGGTYLLRKDEYRTVAQFCLPQLLTQFPSRAKPNMWSALDDLLHAAIAMLPSEALDVIVKDKVAYPRMDGKQRAYWLATGLVLDPDHYLALAACYMTRHPKRMANIAAFLYGRGEVAKLANGASSKVLGVLTEHFAVGCNPGRMAGIQTVTPEMNRAELVQGFINELAGRVDAESAVQLLRLEALPSTSKWVGALRHARMSQQLVRRDATFVHPSWVQACATLEKGVPANPADIAAVVNDTIQDLQEQIKRSDLNLRFQYWNVDSHGRPTEPRHEETCRDAFSDQLRVRLDRFGIGCMPENRHADGKMSDLWCTTSLLGVPIEAKRDRHAALWTATKGQLIPRYADDPRAKGYGIYVVFWFGVTKLIPAPPNGLRPNTPQELERMLENQLSEDERVRITVHVIDCSID